jgi:thiamine biosynthesis lipoprotein
VKAHLGDADNPPPERVGEAATITVDGDRVTATAPVDLNGLAKGYVVDRAAEAVRGLARRGFVDGGGDLSPPTGPVAVENPFGDGKPLVVLDTDWAIATSGTTRRCRGDVDHIYDPAAGRLGAAQDAVTVVARRDCTEADALATALAALPTDRALALVDDWAGAEATLVRNGVVRRSEGFGDHVHRS